MERQRAELEELIDAVRVDPAASPSSVAVLVGARRRLDRGEAVAAALSEPVVSSIRGLAPERYDELAEGNGWPGGQGSHR